MFNKGSKMLMSVIISAVLTVTLVITNITQEGLVLASLYSPGSMSASTTTTNIQTGRQRYDTADIFLTFFLQPS